MIGLKFTALEKLTLSLTNDLHRFMYSDTFVSYFKASNGYDPFSLPSIVSDPSDFPQRTGH